MWDIARLEQLISSRTEESLTLEYKAAGALDDKNKREITKDISAMANSDGGTIIYGMAEHADPSKRHLPEKLEPIDRSKFSKEWLEHVASNIQPKIENLRIFPVELQPNPNHVVYVVEIPKAATAHQAQDLRYYRRYNFECQAMPDYQIRELMNRQKFPAVSVSANLIFFGNGGSLHVEIQNTSEVLAKNFEVVLRTPIKWKGRAFLFGDGEYFVLKEGDCELYIVTFDNASDSPLFPKCTVFHNFKFSWAEFLEPKATPKDIRYQAFADGMPFVEGTFDPEKILTPAMRPVSRPGNIFPV